MSKLTENQIRQELAWKHFYLKDLNNYKNLDSEIIILCEKGHEITTTLKTFRNEKFYCPQCRGASQNMQNLKKEIPDKPVGVKRVVSLDNATEKMGVAVFDDGKLVFADVFSFRGELIDRLVTIYNFLEKVIATKKPDMFIFEDIQYQNNIMTYKVLAMLLGLITTCAHRNKIPFEVEHVKSWKSYFLINGENRAVQKRQSITKVKEIFNIDVKTDDVSDAILLGYYYILKNKKIKSSF